jgi:hypothetical protein
MKNRLQAILGQIEALVAEARRLIVATDEGNVASVPIAGNAGKRERVRAALADAELQRLSNRQLARLTNTSHTYVANLRKQMETELPESRNEVATVSEDGKCVSSEAETKTERFPQTEMALPESGKEIAFVAKKTGNLSTISSSSSSSISNQEIEQNRDGVPGGNAAEENSTEFPPIPELTLVTIDFWQKQPYAAVAAALTPSLSDEERKEQIFKFCATRRSPRWGGDKGLTQWLRNSETYKRRGEQMRAAAAKPKPAAAAAPGMYVGATEAPHSAPESDDPQSAVQSLRDSLRDQWREEVENYGSLRLAGMSEAERIEAMAATRARLGRESGAQFTRLPDSAKTSAAEVNLVLELGKERCGDFDAWVKARHTERVG